MDGMECTVDWLVELLEEDRAQGRMRRVERPSVPIVMAPGRPSRLRAAPTTEPRDSTGEPRDSTGEWLALASLVFGLAWGFGIGSFVALVTGWNAVRSLAPDKRRHRAVARAGIALGAAGLALAAVLVVRIFLVDTCAPALGLVAHTLAGS